MKRVGITGGIGCGKSTVAECFRSLGVPCFVADEVAGRYYSEPLFLADVKRLFGPSVIRPDGTADKRRIADIVFADRGMLMQLNALVHPRVMADFDAFCSRHADVPYVLFESAILYDYGLDRQMDAVVCVYLSMEERLSRLALRDHATPEQLRARMENQWPAEEMMRRADFVVLNYEGNPRRRQVEWIHRALLQQSNKNSV